MSDRGDIFDADYFLRGEETGKSNYTDYRYLGEPTRQVCIRMMRFLGAQIGDHVHDFGAATGNYMRALQELGFHVRGNDISWWAVKHCHASIQGKLFHSALPMEADWILAKDVMEHIPQSELVNAVDWMLRKLKKGALVIVPLGNSDTNTYGAPQDNADKTHVICWNLSQWLHFLQSRINECGRDMAVSGGFKLLGVKTACDPYPESVGFLTVKAI